MGWLPTLSRGNRAQRILFTIAVSRPEKLEPLPGALAAAQWISTWANEADFTPYAITDEGHNDVTVDRVKDALKLFVNANTPEETEEVFDRFPELQHPAADVLLQEWVAIQPNQSAKTRVVASRMILARCKEATVFRAVLEARAILRY